MGIPLQVEIGDPILFEQVSHLRKRRELLQYLRTAVYELGGRPEIALREGTCSENY